VRYDQLMALGWKVLMPVNLVWILILAGLRLTARNYDQTRWLVLAGIVVTLLLLVLLWPEKEKDDKTQAKRKVDTGVGGYPTPPVDLVVPPNPHLKRIEAQRVAATVGARSGTGDAPGGGDPAGTSGTGSAGTGSAASGGKEE
jgi:NADH-quinone oxidoreductase subunit H